MHVLVVDDHGTNRKLLRVQLEAESFTVSEAAEGREALELLEKEPVDVVVSDILMPGMDGFRFCRELRANPRLRHLPFIIYTSTYTSAADEKLALKAGADRFVRKPCPASELLALIRDAAAQAGRRTPQLSQLPDELEVTREYSDALVRKLEQKNTDLQQAAEEMQRQREWLRVTLTSIGDAVIACDLEGCVTFINPVAASLTGWPVEEATGSPVQKVFAIMNEKTRRPAEDVLGRVLFERRPISLTNNTVLLARDGREIPIEDSAAPILDGEGNTIGVVLVFHDVTEMRHSARERQLTADFLALTNTAADSTSLLEDAARFFLAHSGCAAVGVRIKQGDDYPYCQAFGLPAQFAGADNTLLAVTASGKTVVGKDGAPALQCICGRVIGGAQPRSYWTNNLSSGADGGPLRGFCGEAGYESIALLPLVVGPQRLGLLQFADPRKGMFSTAGVSFWERLASHLAVALAKFRAEEGLLSLNETLESRVAERTALAESRSHLLQALAVELTETEERERRRISELLHDDLQQILVGARMQVQALMGAHPSLASLGNVDRLIADSIQQSRRLSHEMSPALFRTTGLAVALQALARQMQEHHGLSVELETSEAGPGEDVAVRMLVFRSIQELLFNVVKHALVKTALVRLERADGCLTVSVTDNGKGFDVAAVGSSSEKTTGLGLLSIKERVHAMGGAFTIESSPGTGSTLTLSIPLSLSDPPSRPQEGRSSAPAAGATTAASAAARVSRAQAPQGAEVAGRETPHAAFRVLFVDDHDLMRRGMIELICLQPGISVVGEASNGMEAIEKARELRPDVIVMDVSMPRMDGIEATRRIKSEQPAVRIIGLSMFEGEEVGRRMCEAGAETFVMKSGSVDALVKVIFGPGDDP